MFVKDRRTIVPSESELTVVARFPSSCKNLKAILLNVLSSSIEIGKNANLCNNPSYLVNLCVTAISTALPAVVVVEDVDMVIYQLKQQPSTQVLIAKSSGLLL